MRKRTAGVGGAHGRIHPLALRETRFAEIGLGRSLTVDGFADASDR